MAEVFDFKNLELIGYQYRWMNPGANPNVCESELAWRFVEPCGGSLEQKVATLRLYKYEGKPCYEVRPVFAPVHNET